MASDNLGKCFQPHNGDLQSCIYCDSRTVRAGIAPSGKQRWRCVGFECGKTFVVDPGIPEAVRIMVDRMLAEGVGPAKIARVVEGAASRDWVYVRSRKVA